MKILGMLFPTASSRKLETTSVWIKTNHICVPYWVLFSFNHQNDKEIGLSSRRRQQTGWWIRGPSSGPPAPNTRHSSLYPVLSESPSPGRIQNYPTLSPGVLTGLHWVLLVPLGQDSLKCGGF